MNIEIINSLKQRAKEMLENNYNRKIGDEEVYTIICELENFYTAYEKEKEKNYISKDKIEERGDSIDESTMLKQIKSKLEEKNIPIETLLAEFERLEDLEDDLTIVYLNGVYDGEKKVEDKIKAKIEEIKKYKDLARDSIEERIVIADSDSLNYGRKEAHEKDIEVLQSLLEKE